MDVICTCHLQSWQNCERCRDEIMRKKTEGDDNNTEGSDNWTKAASMLPNF
jgi:hypothetical protein